MAEFVELENFSEMKSNLGKLGKTLGVLALATQFSVKSLLCSFPVTEFWETSSEE